MVKDLISAAPKVGKIVDDVNYSGEERGKDIIMVMTEAEYETLYGEKFNEKRQMKTIKLGEMRLKNILFGSKTIKKSNLKKYMA